MKSGITFIGSGNMALSMLKGIINKNLWDTKEITMCDPIKERLIQLQHEYNINIKTDNVKASRTSQYIILAVKPNILPLVLDEIKSELSEDSILVSIAAGVTMQTIEAIVGKDIKIIRAMPNMPALVSEGMTSLTHNQFVSDDEYHKIYALFQSLGRVENIPEHLFDVTTATASSSPAIAYMFIEAIADGSVLRGLPRKLAYEMASQAVLGAAKMVLESGKHPSQLIDEVCSPGGTTIEAVYLLEKRGFKGSIIESTQLCIDKAEKLGKATKINRLSKSAS
jgi:pyrroline-5-carboxylate reductase